MNKRRARLSKADKKLVVLSLEALRERRDIELCDVVEIARPYHALNWDANAACERDLEQLGRQMLGSFKDENGVRTFYSTNDKRYVNVETTTEVSDLNAVSKQLGRKYFGLQPGLGKVASRRITLNQRRAIGDQNPEV